MPAVSRRAWRRLVRRVLIRRWLLGRRLLDRRFGLLDLVRGLLLIRRDLGLLGDLGRAWSQILVLIGAGTLALARQRSLTRRRILILTAAENRRSGALVLLSVGLALTALRVSRGRRSSDAVGIESHPKELPFTIVLLLVPSAQ